MGTRSRIGIELSDASILSVYCHYDGYPEFNGVKLVENFNTREKVKELIDGGDMSCAWTKDRWTGKQVAKYVIENVEVEEYGPQYYSERNESCPPRLDDDITEFLDNGEEYSYIFTRADEWICYDLHDISGKLTEIPEGALAV